MTHVEISPIAQNIINKFATKTGATLFSAYRINLASSLFDYAVRYNLGMDIDADVYREVHSILNDRILTLETILEKEECDILAKEIAAVVNDCFDFYSRSIRSSEEIEASTPKEIIAFINELYHPNANSTVYTPFMGIGSHILQSPSDIQFVGEEISDVTWALAQINMYASSRRANIIHGDSFDELKKKDISFDSILLMPPFGLRDDERNEYSAVIDAIENKLKHNGCLIALLPLSFAYAHHGAAFALRKYLIDHRYLSAIMTLPPVLGGTNIKPCLLFIEKSKQRQIGFFDFSSFSPKDDYLRRFSYKSAIEAIEQRNSAYAKIIAYSDLRYGANLNLTPSARLYTLPQSEYPVKKLSTLIKVIRTSHIRNQQVNYLVIEETSKEKEVGAIQEFTTIRRELRNGVLALPSTLAFYRQPMPKFAITPEFDRLTEVPYAAPMGTEFYEIINNEVNKEYLEAALNSPYVLQQIDVQGADRIFLNRIDLSEIFVPIPSREIQDKMIEQYHEKLRQRYARLARIYGDRAGVLDVAKDLKHMLGLPFSNVFNALASLERIVKDDPKAMKYLIQIKDNLNYSDRIIRRDSVDFGDEHDFPKEKIFVHQFFEDYRRGWDNYGAGCFRLEIIYILGNNPEKDYIYGNPDALRIMLDALLENARRHGFRKKYRESNLVTIHLFLDDQRDDQVLTINVHNNGYPLPDDFTFEDFITAGKYASETGHSGLGGKHIFEITKSFGGEMDMPSIEDHDPTFQFYLPANRKA